MPAIPNLLFTNRITKLLVQQALGYINSSVLEEFVDLLPLNIRWGLLSYANRKKITIDSTKVSGSSTLVNIPIVIEITDSDLTSAQADGSDIIIADAQFKKLDYEIESFDNSTGKLTCWVRIPQLKHDVDTKIYVYWEKNTTVIDQQNKNGVWDTDYEAVYHLNDNVQAGDSTSNAKNMTATGTATIIANGKIGKSLSFNNAPFFTVANFAGIANTSVTMECWVKPQVGTQFDNFIGFRKQATFEFFYMLRLSGSNALEVRHSGTGNPGFHDFTPTPTVLNNQWDHHVMCVDTVNDVLEYFKNGISQGVNALSGVVPFTNTDLTFYMGSDENSNLYNGELDEVRISSSLRPPSFIKTQYDNTNSPGTFMSFGAKETL